MRARTEIEGTVGGVDRASPGSVGGRRVLRKPGIGGCEPWVERRCRTYADGVLGGKRRKPWRLRLGRKGAESAACLGDAQEPGWALGSDLLPGVIGLVGNRRR